MKKIATTVLILIILISFGTVLGIITYLDSIKKIPPAVVRPTTSSAISTPIPNIDISDWKIYRNDKYGFEFKYPSNDWETKEYNNNGINILISSSKWRSDMPEGGGSITINIRDISLDNFISEYNRENKQYCDKVILKKEEFVFNNFKATKLTACTSIGLDIVFIFVVKENKSYIIDYQDYDPIQKQILSTFKFIEK